MKEVARWLIIYGLGLIALGTIGYLSNPKKAQTALYSGGGFGAISICLGVLVRRGVPWALPTSLFLVTLFSLLLIWRSVVVWKAVAAGERRKAFVGSLLALMLLFSVFLLPYLFQSWR
ncbi:hypothetical protein MAMC_01734 [Methylacidimicrobium cyclopophantes]|uniref:Uncharacterized protein n=1 Tax=Methylacidimicrobium cyclopophantes TaxID=1041766 RepID=A0A5E6MQ38_9BACT|nr:TMEM14 family protein [Methylacidimicrobium cyclopophantes]VVM07640.1 hypothetical protein MAMC_01734 [Methylacidimicrobium cyclopophantes]